ncbi:hypothetical protein [Streptomyces halstedii]|uniref:hypothetical protein n=1 Tax=Streptomyces halstedii TaxID=1944 RepID=UPI003434D5EB
MATSKPRITVTLDDDVHQLYRELADIQGCSMSSLVADLLRATVPVQQQVLAAMKTALSLQEGSRAEFLEKLQRAHQQASDTVTPMMAILGEFEGTQPPHSNTGVTTQNQQAESSPKNPAKPSKSSLPAVKTTRHREGGQ